jgi:hypothetical protein
MFFREDGHAVINRHHRTSLVAPWPLVAFSSAAGKRRPSQSRRAFAPDSRDSLLNRDQPDLDVGQVLLECFLTLGRRQWRALCIHPRGEASGPVDANVSSPIAIYFGPIGPQRPFVDDYPAEKCSRDVQVVHGALGRHKVLRG